MYFVYLLQSEKDLTYYTGFTENLNKRITDHNSGYAKYSSRKQPYKLIWYCEFKNKEQALKFEKYLKSGSGIAFRNKHII